MLTFLDKVEILLKYDNIKQDHSAVLLTVSHSNDPYLQDTTTNHLLHLLRHQTP